MSKKSKLIGLMIKYIYYLRRTILEKGEEAIARPPGMCGGARLPYKAERQRLSGLNRCESLLSIDFRFQILDFRLEN